MSQGALKRLTRLAVSPAYYPGDALPAGRSRLAFVNFQPNARTEVIDMQADMGGMGTLSHYATNKRNNRVLVEPELECKPTIDEWALLLPWLMNGTPSGSGTVTYPLGTVGSRRILAFDDTDKVWTMPDVQVASWTISGQAGGEVSLGVRCGGITYDLATPFPASPAGLTFTPRALFGEQAVTAAGVTDPIRPRSLSVSCDHGQFNDRFYGSFTSAGPINTDRRVTVSMELPSALHQQLWAAGAGDAGVAMAVAYTIPGTTSSRGLVVTLPSVRAAAPPVTVADPELMYTWVGEAGVAVGTTTGDSEMIIVLDTVDA